MSGDDQQGMLGIPNDGNITNGGIITHDQMPFGSSSVPIPSWNGDYMPQPTNPEQYGNWFSATEDQGSSQQRLLLEQAGWISSPAEAQGSNQRLLESSIMQMNTNIPAASSSKQRIINGCYDPMFEAMGLPLDPHLRVFLSKLNTPASNGGK
uniref:uncharacterized protein LOC105352581 n=1 Tax=Fragaria vesca subsp. vesca TaxID=101020 RepID=UPI0005CA3D69|nr:PREDICTED: uncharacterized protein LOC105352581 [Fragaria vesca subsp. vesca]